MSKLMVRIAFDFYLEILRDKYASFDLSITLNANGSKWILAISTMTLKRRIFPESLTVKHGL